MNPSVDTFLQNAKQWKVELELLRSILLDCGLTEEYKWKQPCYSFKGKNIIIIGGFKSCVSISFFKGVLLQDEKGLLTQPGENSQSTRMLKFNSVKEIEDLTPIIKAYIFESIEIEKTGQKVEMTKSKNLDLTEELLEKMSVDSEFKTAFESLTPGRQRAYHIYFSRAKQSKTRIDRIEKYTQRILDGFGFHDCVCGLSKRGGTCDGSPKHLK
jgi:uncharacterized protein YdeI (YjbR/CyaY-like superfamily)